MFHFSKYTFLALAILLTKLSIRWHFCIVKTCIYSFPDRWTKNAFAAYALRKKKIVQADFMEQQNELVKLSNFIIHFMSGITQRYMYILSTYMVGY